MESPTAYLLRRLAEEGRDDLIAEYKAQQRPYKEYLIEMRKERRAKMEAFWKQKDAEKELERNKPCSECGKIKDECLCVTWYIDREGRKAQQ